MSSLNEHLVDQESKIADNSANTPSLSEACTNAANAQHSHSLSQFSSSTLPPAASRDVIIFKSPPNLCTTFEASAGFSFSASSSTAAADAARKTCSHHSCIDIAAEASKAACESHSFDKTSGNGAKTACTDHSFSTTDEDAANCHSSCNTVQESAKTTSHTSASADRRSDLMPLFMQKTLHTLDQHSLLDIKNRSIVIICQDAEGKHKETEEDVSDDFVNQFNTHIGNSENHDKAQRLILKMRQLGGLDPAPKGQRIDIPAARLGFCMLALLSDHTYKMQALDGLYYLLRSDNLDKAGAIQLVSLAIKLMKNMNRELIQTEIIDVQIKIAQVYNVLTELLQHHYAQHHINAITKELKFELKETANALKDLNRQEDSRLAFNVSSALEGVHRLKDDSKELFDLLRRIYHFSAAAVALYMQDAQAGLPELTQIFKDIDPHFIHEWYNGMLLLNDLAKRAYHDPAALVCMQLLIRDQRKKLGWKFSYGAMEILSSIVVYGSTADIRRKAFDGIKSLGLDFPGLASFADSADLPHYTSWKPVTHLQAPLTKDPNIRIRIACIEHLRQIFMTSPDKTIRYKAAKLLWQRLYGETDYIVWTFLAKAVPQQALPKKTEDDASVQKNYHEEKKE